MGSKSRPRAFLYKLIVLMTVLTAISSCFPQKSKVVVSLKKNQIKDPLSITISNVQVVNHQIIITGTNLNSVSNFKIKEGSTDTNLQIESKSNTSIVANTISNVTFAAGRIFDFILSNANGASTFTVDFSLCDSKLGGKGFNCLITPIDKQVLSYDITTGKWRPRSVNGLNYQGTWSGLPALPATGVLVPGDYYIVSVANGAYNVGDWIVLNQDGVTFEQVENSAAVISVFGRNGNVTAAENDYVLDKMGDVDLSIPPMPGDALLFDGTHWVAGTASGGGVPSGAAGGDLAGTYPNPTIGANKITDAHIANSAISQTKINGLATSLSGKEPAITGAATTTYFRGDKTFVTLDTSVVPEGSRLYFTNARALGILLTGFDNALTGQVTAADSMLQGFGRLQNQINSLSSGGSNYLVKNGADTISGTVSLTNVLTASGAGDIVVPSVPLTMTSAVNKTYADGKLDKTTGGVVAGVVTLDNDLEIKSGANYVTIKGNAATAADYNFVLPVNAGTAGYLLSTDGSGNTSWVTAGGGGAPTGAATGDLGGNYPAPTVDTVGGVTAANVAAGATLANNATTANTANTIVKRDGSGNFTATNVSGVVATTNGGTGANITPVNGGIIYSNATTMAVTAAGTSGQVLKSNGAAAPSWSSLGTAADVNTGVLAGNVPVFGANAVDDSMCTYDTVLGFNCNTALPSGATAGGADTQIQFNDGGAFAGSANFVWDNTGSILDVQGTLRLSGSTSGYVGFAPAAAAGSTTYTLPAADGSSGQVLRTNGAGVLSWVNDNAGAGAFTGTADKAVATNGSGALTTVTTSATELGYVAGVTSAIQTQLDAKQASGNYVTALTGDVTATGPGSVAATVAAVGGVTAANVAAGANLANAATELNTASAIVKRDASGNFSAGTITATLNGTATNVTGTVAVANGGTGATTLGLNQLLFGNGTGVIGTLATTATPSVLLSTVTTGAPTWTTSTAGNVLKGSVTGVEFGALLLSDLPAGTLSGSGTANYIPYYSAASTLANSPVAISGTNVGIGTSSPSKLLDVQGTGNTIASFRRTDDDDTRTDVIQFRRSRSSATPPLAGFGSNLVFRGEGFTDGSESVQAKIGVQWEQDQTNDTTDRDGAILFSSATDDSLSEKMRITSQGRVGIGTTTPSTSLHVNSAGATELKLSGGGFGFHQGAVVMEANGSVHQRALGIYMHDINGATEWFSGRPYSSSDRFVIQRQAGHPVHNGSTAEAAGAVTQFFTVLDTGNVGIGTTTPGARLDVKGAIRMSGATSGYTGFQPAAAAGSTVWTLPAADGTSGQILRTNGAGILSWVNDNSGAGAFTGTASRAVATDGAGALTTTATTATEIGYLAGVTSAIQTQLDAKEPTITAGTTAQYLRGDKTLATFSTDVRASTLTGLSSTAGNIAATDTVLQAFGKMLNTQTDYVSKSGDNTVTGSFNITGITAFLDIPTPTGTTLSEAANVDYVKTYVGSAITAIKLGDLSDAYTSTVEKSIFIGEGTPEVEANGNVALGYESMKELTTGTSNTAVGETSMTSITDGYSNTAMGWYAMSSTTDGGGNTAIGSEAMTGMISAWSNTGIGQFALYNLTTGNSNTAVGDCAGCNMMTGDNNVSLGETAGRYNPAGSNNVNIGKNAGAGPWGSPQTRNDNVIIGHNASNAMTTGSGNIVFGSTSATSLTSGSRNIVIGNNINVGSATASNTLNIGNFIFGTGLNGTGTTLSNGFIGIGTTAPGSALDVKGTLRLSGSTSGYVGFAPAAAAGSTVWTLPAADGTVGQVLSTNGAGVLSWTASGAGAFSGTASRAVATDGSGALTTTATTATELGYVNGVTSSIQTQLNAKEPTITAGTSSQYLKGDKTLGTFLTDIMNSLLTGISFATNSAITAADNLLAALGKLQAQITSLASSKLSLTGGTLTGGGTISGVPTPTNADDVANKGYVDGYGQWGKTGDDVHRTVGSVGIGTASPDATLTVQGAAVSRSNIIATGATVNLALANNHLLKAPGGSAITLQNPVDGGVYTMVVADTTSRTYTFSGCTNSYFSPENGATTDRSTYTVMVVVDGTDTECYITWITGFN